MSFNLQAWYKQMEKDSVILAYRGTITAELITNILDTIETKLRSIAESTKTRKKIYNVLVETLQNLYHHLDEPPSEEKNEFDEKYAIFVFSKTKNGYTISTGNFIKKDKVKFLRDRMEQINYLSREELKTLYRLILDKQGLTEKGGGGLGMIDIAKKTGNKLEYKFYDYNQDYSIFALDNLINV